MPDEERKERRIPVNRKWGDRMLAADPGTAGFWAAVFALAWFCHGVLVAWVRPADRTLALVETLLAVVVVLTQLLLMRHQVKTIQEIH